MRNFIFVISFFISTNLSAGYIDYYNAVNEGEYHMYEGQYELAIDNFERAFLLVDSPKARDYFLVSKCYSQIGNEEEMQNHLELAILGGLEKSYITADSLWFSNYRFTKTYKSILKLKPLKTEKYQDKESREEFKNLEKKFNIPKVISFYKAYENRDSLPEKYKRKLEVYTPYQDSMTSQLTGFLSNYSFPKNQKDMRLLITMSRMFLSKDLPCFDSLKTVFTANLDKGMISPVNFAVLFDRVPLERLAPQKLGINRYGTTENSIAKKDFDQILKNRKEIGLSTHYIVAPNYSRNYKPEPIALIIQPKDFEIIGYD